MHAFAMWSDKLEKFFSTKKNLFQKGSSVSNWMKNAKKFELGHYLEYDLIISDKNRDTTAGGGESQTFLHFVRITP